MKKGFLLCKFTNGESNKSTKGNADSDEKIDEDIGGQAASEPTETETYEISGPEDLRDELLPGILNDIACQLIVPKLSGADINRLYFVSPSWHEAIHRRWVYDLRLRSHSTEPFVVVVSYRVYSPKSTGGIWNLRLYPLNGNGGYELPSIHHPENIRHGCMWVPLDGKIYILGGRIRRFTSIRCPIHNGSREMFMLDLAGHKQWKRCAPMQEGRHSFCAGILDGKIYVIGGLNESQSVSKCEVYDPKTDAWSTIADRSLMLFNARVASIRGEVIVYGGSTCGRDLLPAHFSQNAVAYNPVKNEWREFGHYNGDWEHNPWVRAFVAQGKFHTMTQEGIDVYDMDKNSWSSLHSFPFDGRDRPLATGTLGEEILELFEGLHGQRPRYCLLQNREFGTRNRAIAFQEVGNRHLNSDPECLSWRDFLYDMCPLQL